MSRCVVVKAGIRCQHDSTTHTYGLTVPLVRTDAIAWLCGDCIYDMYTAMTAGDFTRHNTSPLTPEQIKQEFGR